MSELQEDDVKKTRENLDAIKKDEKQRRTVIANLQKEVDKLQRAVDDKPAVADLEDVERRYVRVRSPPSSLAAPNASCSFSSSARRLLKGPNSLSGCPTTARSLTATNASRSRSRRTGDGFMRSASSLAVCP